MAKQAPAAEAPVAPAVTPETPNDATTAVAAAKSTAVGAVINYEADAGQGFENADRDSYAIPFIIILQSMSPYCKKSDGAYIKGAEEGVIMNTVTQELFSSAEGIRVIPCHYSREMIEWKIREVGGGFVKVWQVGEEPETTTDAKNREITQAGTQIVDTRSHYVLVVRDDGSYFPALITMTSTQLKKSRNWMAKMDGLKGKRGDGSYFTLPMFSHIFHLTTIPETNEKGSWFGWKIETEKQVDDPNLYAAAKAFRDQLASGAARADMSKSGDDIPF